MIDIRLTRDELELLVSTLYARLDALRRLERTTPNDRRTEFELNRLLTALESNLHPPTNPIKNQP